VKQSGKSFQRNEDKKATVHDVSGDLLELLGEDGLRTVTQLINNTHETGKWSKDFTQVTMIALKKKPKTI